MSRNVNKWVVLFVTAFVLLASGLSTNHYLIKEKRQTTVDLPAEQPLMEVKSVAKLRDAYDVIVVGTDPEGVAAAISASRNGLKTLLVEDKPRDILGGLMTLGWLNSLDNNYDPLNKTPLSNGRHPVLNKGIFSEWYDMIEGDSFDVNTAANAFYKLLLKEKNVDLYMHAKALEPIVETYADNEQERKRVTGLTVTLADGTKQLVHAKAVVDASQDADVAAAAGVPFTIGHEDLGDKSARMAVTLVFRLGGVTPEVWSQISKRLNQDESGDTGANNMSAWGYGAEMREYVSTQKDRVKMRGLNIGRQKDDSILINALQIFGVDGLDDNSKRNAIAAGKRELPHVVEFLNKTFPEFKNVKLEGTAPELYVRETRHMLGEYRLTILDELENRDQWDRVALGSYPVDIQALNPADSGSVALDPLQYAIPFRSLVPIHYDGILVVGRCASYDTLPHGSARVIPNGMAEAQAAGAAAKIAIDKGMTFKQLSESKESIALLQKTVNEQGMDIKPFSMKPMAYMDHKAYPGLKAAVFTGIAYGSYKNDFNLDEASNPQRWVNYIGMTQKRHPSYLKGDPSASLSDIKEAALKQPPLTLEQASRTVAYAVGLTPDPGTAADLLKQKGLLTAATTELIAEPNKLTNGDTYLMLKDLLEGRVGLRF